MIAVIDYHKGNIKSVERGLAANGVEVVVSDEPSVIAQADALVLPGVGAFTDAMDTLHELKLVELLRTQIRNGIPFLGICLGMHLLFSGGVEHARGSEPTEGLGVIEGVVCHMPRTDTEGQAYKVPHVGWNAVEPTVKSTTLFEGIPSGQYFYFTHSYIAPPSEATIATTSHSVTFPSAIRHGNAFGVQFHPEKSSEIGARLLANFVRSVKEA